MMKRHSYIWIVIALAATILAYVASSAVLRLSLDSPITFLASNFLRIVVFAVPVALVILLRRATGWPFDFREVMSAARQHQRHPLVLYGITLILMSYVWSGVTAKLVDPNTTTGIVIVFGGWLMLSAAGYTLVGYRIWTRLRDVFH